MSSICLNIVHQAYNTSDRYQVLKNLQYIHRPDPYRAMHGKLELRHIDSNGSLKFLPPLHSMAAVTLSRVPRRNLQFNPGLGSGSAMDFWI